MTIKLFDIVHRDKTIHSCEATDNLVVAFDKLTQNKVHALLVKKDGKYVAFLGITQNLLPDLHAADLLDFIVHLGMEYVENSIIEGSSSRLLTIEQRTTVEQISSEKYINFFLILHRCFYTSNLRRDRY